MSRATLSLPESEWPDPDAVLWRAVLAPVDFFEDDGIAKDWRPSTIAHAKYAYGQWLKYLRDAEPSSLTEPPADRFTVERAKRFVKQISSRLSAAGAAAAIGHFILASRATAPSFDYLPLQSAQRRHLAVSKRRDKRTVMVRADELFGLGMDLMAMAQRDGVVHDVLTYRDGLIIALLASRPLRRKNLAEMRLDKHVAISGGGIHITFDADEVKGGRELELCLPQSITRAFLHYLSAVRPRFRSSNDHQFVWCSNKRGSLRADGIYQMVLRRTTVAFGSPINPHLFRDIAATAIAVDRPEEVRLSKDLLGHSSLELTERHYLHAQSVKGGKHLSDVIRAIRNGAK
jgi:integrase